MQFNIIPVSHGGDGVSQEWNNVHPGLLAPTKAGDLVIGTVGVVMPAHAAKAALRHRQGWTDSGTSDIVGNELADAGGGGYPGLRVAGVAAVIGARHEIGHPSINEPY